MTPAEEAADTLGRWREDPVAFVRECIGAEPDAWQLIVLQAATCNIRIALKACKGVGKSAVLAWIVWWFLATRINPKVVCTSISKENLRDGLWAELALWQRRSELLKREFVWSAERIWQKDNKATWWAAARAWSKTADPDEQANTLAGVHADSILFVLDESGGIPDAVMETAEAILANISKEAGREALLIQAGNPTQLSGPLYRACTKERDIWWVYEITGDPDAKDRSPRMSLQWAKERIEKRGRDHPWIRANILGLFPLSSTTKLINLETARAATLRKLDPKAFSYAPRILGVDVGWKRDATVIVRRQGYAVTGIREIWGNDPMKVVGQVLREMEEFQPDAVFVDVIGIGAGVVSRLRELGHKNVIGVNVGEGADTDRHLNRRAQVWEAMADWVKEGGCLPAEAGALVEQMCEPDHWYRSDGKMQLESKDDLCDRGVDSPDQADALSLTFAFPVKVKTDADRAREQIRASQRATAAKAGRSPNDYEPIAQVVPLRRPGREGVAAERELRRAA